jgi:excisionase family DNA binding protein
MEKIERLLLSIPEAAEMLGISPWTIRKLIRRAALPCVRIGRRVLVEVGEVANFVQRNRGRR